VLRRGGDHAAGTPHVPHLAYWHALRPRDDAASQALRGVTDADALALLTGAKAEYDAAKAASPEGHPDPVPVDTVAAALPGVTHQAIAVGVASITRVAARLARGLVAFGTPPAATDSEDPAEYRPEHGTDSILDNATSGLSQRRGYVYYGGKRGAWGTLNNIRATADVLTAAAESPADTWVQSQLPMGSAVFEWTGAIGRAAPYLVRAASPTTSEEHRVGLTLLAEELAADAFHRPGQLRRVVLCAEYRSHSRIGQVMRRGDRVVVVIASDGWGDERRQHYLALDYDPTGAFGAIDGFATHDSFPVEHHVDPGRIAELARKIRESGPIPWSPEAAEAFATATGARRNEAALLLAGLPAINEYGRHALDADQRAVLGMKAAEAATARDKMRAVDLDARTRMLTALIPADPDTWWTTGHDIDAAAAAWHAHFGDVVRVPEDIAVDAAAARIGDGMLDPVLNPASYPQLTRTTAQRLDKDRVLVADDPEAIPHSHLLASCVRAMTWLAYRLPYGHPLRAVLPRTLTALRERLADPGLMLDLGLSYAERGGYVSVALREAVGMPETGGADPDGIVRVGDAIALTPWYENAEHVLIRTGHLTGPDDPDLARLIALGGASRSWPAEALRTVLGDAFATLVAAGADGIGGETGHAQDAAWSVPDLVAEVAKTHELDPDAAALYLQLLALPDPTDRNIARWTGWKPARLKAARAALGATDLVVTAKRARAGRTLFLPGGWHEFKTAVPLETWKSGLYPVVDGPSLVPTRPVPELFRAAWQRVQEGDAPGFEQLVTRTTRRGRRR
ncbi:MAG: hypothetical protein HOV68_30135, partial [Streptomycetaceae bacterium]|nr:hypothetical protein [Streptomycetaceae bacterium]